MTYPSPDPYGPGTNPYGLDPAYGAAPAAPAAAAPNSPPPAAAADPAGPPALLTADEILAADDRSYDYVPVPEWGGTVRVRGLNGTERDDYEGSLLDSKNRVKVRNARAKLVQLCLVDERGQLLFSQAQIAALGRKSAAALTRVFEVAQRLSGLSDEDLEELEGE